MKNDIRWMILVVVSTVLLTLSISNAEQLGELLSNVMRITKG
ncbi:hypothetical protein [Arenicella xantha]|nr:hypothetical protein [Arenicella xantha]